MLDSILFNIFIMGLLMTQSWNYRMISQRVMLPSGGTLTGWEKWAGRNLTCFNKKQCELLQLVGNKVRHQ